MRLPVSAPRAPGALAVLSPLAGCGVRHRPRQQVTMRGLQHPRRHERRGADHPLPRAREPLPIAGANVPRSWRPLTNGTALAAASRCPRGPRRAASAGGFRPRRRAVTRACATGRSRRRTPTRRPSTYSVALRRPAAPRSSTSTAIRSEPPARRAAERQRTRGRGAVAERARRDLADRERLLRAVLRAVERARTTTRWVPNGISRKPNHEPLTPAAAPHPHQPPVEVQLDAAHPDPAGVVARAHAHGKVLAARSARAPSAGRADLRAPAASGR